MTCHPCHLAQSNPHSGRFDTGCRACTVRHVALMPQLHRRLYIDALAPDNREAFTEEVKTEMRRHKALKATA